MCAPISYTLSFHPLRVWTIFTAREWFNQERHLAVPSKRRSWGHFAVRANASIRAFIAALPIPHHPHRPLVGIFFVSAAGLEQTTPYTD